MSWDPEVESPATVAVIGAGATGIEAALYARFLGYNILLFDKAKVAQRFFDLNDSPMQSSFGQSVSKLGLAAIQAQSDKLPSIPNEQVLSHRQFAESYLVPLARTDLLYDHVNVHSRVVDISRIRFDGYQPNQLQDRANDEFRIVVESKARGAWVTRADIVLDCSGIDGDAVRLGPCDGLAIGQSDATPRIFRSFKEWKSQHGAQASTLVVFGAQANTCLAVEQAIAAHAAGESIKLIWVIPATQQSDDLATVRDAQSKLDAAQCGYHMASLGAEAILRTERDELVVRLLQPDDTTLDIVCDSILAPDRRLIDWGHCRSLLVNSPNRWLDETAERPWNQFPGWRLATPEPNYYVLGSKRNEASNLPRIESHRNQIRDLFALLGTREDLDLYQSIQFSK
jgi:threonine dehydrogenase-like Zn-dependent dehydrogenase